MGDAADDAERRTWQEIEEEGYPAAVHDALTRVTVEMYVVRLWDGMDGLWMDVTKPLTYEEAMEKWNEFTEDGTEARSYSDIDYYKVFPADTVMHFDGSTPNRTMR